MKAIRLFLWITAIVMSLGAITMIDDGTFDIYSLWVLIAFWLSIYYIEAGGKK